MQLTLKKTLKSIIECGNHYLAAVKGNQPKLYQAIQSQFVPQQTWEQINKGHGRKEKRKISICRICHLNADLADWPEVATIIRVESERKTKQTIEKETRYYISDLQETAKQFYQRIRGYWNVENQVHYVRDVTFGEDRSRIRITPLPTIWAIARNLAINLYRDAGLNNMAQAQRKCQFGLDHILTLFRMK